MYKLIAIDLDGTLLDSAGEVSLKNREALAKAKEKGIEVVLASRKNYWINWKYCNRYWSR